MIHQRVVAPSAYVFLYSYRTSTPHLRQQSQFPFVFQMAAINNEEWVMEVNRCSGMKFALVCLLTSLFLFGATLVLIGVMIYQNEVFIIPENVSNIAVHTAPIEITNTTAPLREQLQSLL